MSFNRLVHRIDALQRPSTESQYSPQWRREPLQSLADRSSKVCEISAMLSDKYAQKSLTTDIMKGIGHESQAPGLVRDWRCI